MAKIKLPKTKPKGALPSGATRIGDTEFDPRFDPRKKEQERIKETTVVVDPTADINPPTVSLVDYEGYPFVTSMSDRTRAGGVLTNIEGVDLNRPVELLGGQDYMFANPGQVWASGAHPVRQIMAQAAALKEATGRDPLYMPWRMAPTGSDFASMSGETMLNFAEANMGKRAKQRLDKQIKTFIPDWVGVDSDKSIEQFRSAPDTVRKAIKGMMDVDFREEGGLNIGQARLATADPRQYNAPDSHIMNVGRIFADEPIIMDSGHVWYPRGVPGEGIGIIDKPRSVFELLPDYAKERGIPDPSNPRQTDIRSMQMKPYGGIIDEKLLKALGYREGGMVDQALVDKVNAPAARAMLEMDLARLAVAKDKMQPKKMAKGGIGKVKLPKTVLPAAKRAENLDRMLMHSKIKEPMYHGTPNDFSSFGDSPVFLTKHPEFASSYAESKAVDMTYDPSDVAQGQSVMPLYVDARNPFDYENREHVVRMARQLRKQGNKHFTVNDLKSGSFELLEDPDVYDAMKRLGHDSFYVNEGYGDSRKNLGVFDPKSVKSAIGNVGTYDVSNPDITKAKGGRIKAPKVNAPAVVPRSTLTELQNYVREREGGYGAARLERAADEIKNLEKLYTQDALRQAFTGDNASALMTMNPADFEKFATPIPPSAKPFDPSGGVMDKYSVSTDDYIKYLAEVYAKGGFSDVPFLEINKTEQGLPLTPFISGHEGRHRSRAMAGAGEEAGLVRLLPRAELREPFPRRYREDYIEALKKELEMTGNKVKPQTWTEPDPNSFNGKVIRRPEIDLPDIYAKGGRVTFPSVEEMRIEMMERKNAKN